MLKYLSELCEKDRHEYGNKAVSLGIMMKNGLNVPNGFAISYKLFNDFISDEFLQNKATYIFPSEEIIEILANAEFNSIIKDEIKILFDSISLNNDCSFAVRSSSSIEDTETHSMAGIFSTFINMASFEDILKAIKKCYLSIFDDKVLEYMMENKINVKDVKIGIIIQRFIEGDLSGVSFSADAVAVNPDTIVINAVNGLCAGFVNGSSMPSIYKLSKTTKKLINSYVPDDSPCLTQNELDILYDAISLIEKIFGAYQDIEWTICNNILYILQSRPITSFKNCSFPIIWKDSNDSNHTWVCEYDNPLKPLEQELVLLGVDALKKGACNDGFEYINIVFHNGYPFKRSVLEKDAKEKYLKSFRKSLKLFGKDMNIFSDILLPEIIGTLNALKKYTDKELSFNEAYAFLESSRESWLKSREHYNEATLGRAYNRDYFNQYCCDITGKSIDHKDLYDLVYKKSKLGEEREHIISMAFIVKSEPKLFNLFEECKYNKALLMRLHTLPEAKNLIEQINTYLSEYGVCHEMHLFKSIESILQPIIVERPEYVIDRIRSCIHVDYCSYLDVKMEIESRKNEIKSLILESLNEEERSQFLIKLKIAEQSFLAMDNHKYYFDWLSNGYLRMAVISIGKILCSNGLISSVEDTLFLTLFDIKMALLHNTLDAEMIIERKKIFDEQKNLLVPSQIGFEEQKRIPKNYNEKESTCKPKVLKGISGLKKKVRSKVVREVSQKIDYNCILVLEHGYCDIFHALNKVKGIIFEGGSPYDHLGIIAREMNIPTIYYVKNALKLLQDGDEVELDGIKGVVNIL